MSLRAQALQLQYHGVWAAHEISRATSWILNVVAGTSGGTRSKAHSPILQSHKPLKPPWAVTEEPRNSDTRSRKPAIPREQTTIRHSRWECSHTDRKCRQYHHTTRPPHLPTTPKPPLFARTATAPTTQSNEYMSSPATKPTEVYRAALGLVQPGLRESRVGLVQAELYWSGHLLHCDNHIDLISMGMNTYQVTHSRLLGLLIAAL